MGRRTVNSMDLNTYKNPALRAIAAKVLEGEPVSTDDAMAMLTTADILELEQSPIMCARESTAPEPITAST